jgi:hypothetical protein
VRSFAPRAGFTALTSKRGNKNFYKGKGARSTGHHTRKGAPRRASAARRARAAQRGGALRAPHAPPALTAARGAARGAPQAAIAC